MNKTLASSNEKRISMADQITIRTIGIFMKTRRSSILATWAVLAVTTLVPLLTARADALDHWAANLLTNQNAGFSGSGATGVAYGNGRYVAVGLYSMSDFGFIESSEDGITWTVSGDGYLTLEMHDVAFGNGVFVAVGYDGYGGANLYSSTNGINWTSQTNATVSNFYGVTYGRGTFVAVGDGWAPTTGNATSQNIYTSTDGINWTMQISGAATPIYDVAYGAGRFVAVDGAGYSYTSTFGTAWTRSYFGGSFKISFCNGLFIVPSGPGSNLVSSDGLTWFGLTNNTASTFGRVIYGNGLFLALSSSSIFTSTNGTNWVARNSSTGMVDVVFGNRNAVAVGNSRYLNEPSHRPMAFASDPFVAVNANPDFPPQLNISGLQNQSYRIEYQTNFSGTNWQTLTAFSLTNSPLLWTDTTATNSQRFYRAVLLP